MTNLAGPSYTLGRIFGIPVKVHWSFGLLLLFVGYVAYTNNNPREDIPWLYVLVGLLFVFVIMHEFGHALMAKRFGIKTQDIIISPIGGVARLEGLPAVPKQELLVALAGPLVNVVLATIFIVIQLINDSYFIPQTYRINATLFPSDFIANLLTVNVLLVVFNMIPAFPMDGGRVLRALLSMFLGDKLKATRIASIVGQLFAVAFIAYGMYADHYVLMFVGLFVMVTARSEYRQMRLATKMAETTVREIMSSAYTILNAGDPIRSAFDYTEEKSFLVADESGGIIGCLPQLFVIDAKTSSAGNMLIQQHMSKSIGSLSQGMSVQTAFQAMNEYGWAIAPIVGPDNAILGVVDRDMIRQFLKG